jgi:hypothetical protein
MKVWELRKKKLVTGPKWAPDTRTDWPTDVSCKLTATALTSYQLPVTSCQL